MENQTDLFRHHIKTHNGMMVELEMISGPFQAISIIVITEPRVTYVPREASFTLPLKYTTDTSTDVLLEKNIDDYWHDDRDRELSDTWTGSERFNEKTINVFPWSGPKIGSCFTIIRRWVLKSSSSVWVVQDLLVDLLIDTLATRCLAWKSFVFLSVSLRTMCIHPVVFSFFQVNRVPNCYIHAERIITNSTTLHRRDQSNKYIFGCDAWAPHRRWVEYLRKISKMGIHAPESGWQTNDILGQLVARDMERRCRSSATKRKTKVGYRKTEAWQRSKTARYLLHWSGWQRIFRKLSKMQENWNKHKQWELVQSSSSTWWNWQGSWWSSYHSKSQEGGEPSLQWTGWPTIL